MNPAPIADGQTAARQPPRGDCIPNPLRLGIEHGRRSSVRMVPDKGTHWTEPGNMNVPIIRLVLTDRSCTRRRRLRHVPGVRAWRCGTRLSEPHKIQSGPISRLSQQAAGSIAAAFAVFVNGDELVLACRRTSCPQSPRRSSCFRRSWSPRSPATREGWRPRSPPRCAV